MNQDMPGWGMVHTGPEWAKTQARIDKRMREHLEVWAATATREELVDALLNVDLERNMVRESNRNLRLYSESLRMQMEDSERFIMKIVALFRGRRR